MISPTPDNRKASDKTIEKRTTKKNRTIRRNLCCKCWWICWRKHHSRDRICKKDRKRSKVVGGMWSGEKIENEGLEVLYMIRLYRKAVFCYKAQLFLWLEF